MKKSITLLLAAAACVHSMSAHAVAYTVTNLGATIHALYEINDAGQIASTITGGPGRPQAALWSNGAWQALSPGVHSGAYGLNDVGDVVGYTRVNGAAVATVWRNGTAQLLPGFAGETGAAYDINNAGHIVGISSSSEFFGGPKHVQWKDGQISYLTGPDGGEWGSASGINEAGQIIGGSRIFRYESGVKWENGTASWLGDPNSRTFVNGINNHGAVVGQSRTDNGDVATIWSDNGVLTLDGLTSQFWDINDAGVAVGSANFGEQFPFGRAMLYRDGQTSDLNDLLVGERFGLGELLQAKAINNNGQIVAFASLAGQYQGDAVHAFLLTPVPEPEHYAMLLLGLGMVGFAARRNTGKAAAV